jgi:aminopeptidase N
LSFADPSHQPVVAASAPASVENGALIYVLPNARNFSIAVSPEFLMSSADANGVTIYNYYFPEDAAAAAMAQEMTRMAVNTYSAVFGPYVHSALTVVETDLNDGLETDGLYFLSRNFYREFGGGVQNNLSVIAVHETAHQWWYGAVANNQATEPWLDEAMATYSEHVFFENNYPGLVNWWWNFRVNSKNPSGPVDLRVYDTPSFDAYFSAVYLQGANFFDALRLRIGDAAFFAFLKDYYTRERGSISSAAAFFAILNEHTTVDYSDLLKTYFYYR